VTTCPYFDNLEFDIFDAGRLQCHFVASVTIAVRIHCFQLKLNKISQDQRNPLNVLPSLTCHSVCGPGWDRDIIFGSLAPCVWEWKCYTIYTQYFHHWRNLRFKPWEKHCRYSPTLRKKVRNGSGSGCGWLY